MNRGQLLSLVNGNTGRPDKATLASLALNLAQQDISRRWAFSDLVATVDLAVVANDTFVSLPSGTRQIVELRLINGTMSYPMTLREKSWLVSRHPNPSAVGGRRPCEGYVEGGKLYFDAKSSASYTVRATVNKFPTDMSADVDNPSIANADDALIAYATSYVFKSIQMYDEARFWTGEYATAATERIRDDRREPGVTHQSSQAVSTPLYPFDPNDPLAGMDGRRW